MIKLFLRKDVSFRALKIAIVVGLILAFINHGDHLLKGDMTITNWVKILFTFFVPYCIIRSLKENNNMAIKKENTND